MTPPTPKLAAFLWLLAACLAHGFERDVPLAELLRQTDVVVIGKLSGVTERELDGVAYGEGVIEVSRTLLGAIPVAGKITLRWANRIYRSGALEFADTGDSRFVWLLWRAGDGTFRARQAACQAPLTEMDAIIAAIEKRKPDRIAGSSPAAADPHWC